MKKKHILKWLLVVLIVIILIYTFRDSAGPILNQLKQTTVPVILGICLMAAVYHIFEGIITTLLARQYQREFSFWTGIKNAFICSFYRVATLGSGAGIAAVIYLGENGIPYSTGFGLYMIQYAVHKSSIALFSVVLFLSCFSFMNLYFADYQWLLAAGYLLTLVITLILLLFACSVRFHRLILSLLEFVDRKCKGRFHASILQVREQCEMLEESSKVLIKKPGVISAVIVLNLIKFCFFYGIPYLSLRATEAISFVQTMAVTSLSVMLAAVLPSPAGIGSTEFVFTTLCSQIAGTAAAGSTALLYRFGTFVFPFLAGAVFVAARQIRRHKNRKRFS